MKKLLVVLVLCLVCFASGAAAVLLVQRQPREPPLPDPPALVTQMREVARLETLEVSIYKKVSFAPDPEQRETVWGELVEWARHSLLPPKGRAIVFADVHLGLDLSKLTERSMRVQGSRIDVVLPPLSAKVELKPGETEVIGSNLSSAQTAQLFEKAKEAFEREVMADEALRQRARASAERSLRALLFTIGFKEVRFVDALEPVKPG